MYQMYTGIQAEGNIFRNVYVIHYIFRPYIYKGKPNLFLEAKRQFLPVYT